MEMKNNIIYPIMDIPISKFLLLKRYILWQMGALAVVLVYQKAGGGY